MLYPQVMRASKVGWVRLIVAGCLFMLSMTTATIIGSNAVRALDVDSALAAPTNICGESGLSSVDLSWDTPTDINVTGHVVEYQTSGAASWTAGPAVTEVNRVTVPGVNGTRYTYRVASTNNSGQRSNWGSYCLLGWGAQYSSSIPIPFGRGALTGRTVTKITHGGKRIFQSGNTCALLSDGTAACWGNNGWGQLGDGTTTSSNTPVAVTMSGALTNKTVSTITTSYSHTCAVLSDGTAACWGANHSGQLGNGTTTSSTTPVAVAMSGALTNKTLTTITAGDSYTCAVLSDGTAACWGNNESGQLGDGTTTNSTTPVAVTMSGALTGKTVTTITAGNSHTCAVTSDGTVACWGNNGWGQLGDGTTTSSTTPVAVTMSGALAGKTVNNITAGYPHTCAVTSDGTVACWGYNYSGQLGNDTTTYSTTPVVVTMSGALTNKTVTDITAGISHTCALTSDGTAACWGNNGELGNGATIDSNTPVAVAGGGFTLLASGGSSVVGMSDGSFVAGESPTAPLGVTSSVSGRVVTVTWTAPADSGAGPVTGYRSQYSHDAGRTWSTGSDWSASLSGSFSVPRDGYVLVRVQAKNAATTSSWAVGASEVLITTALSLPSITKSNVTVTFQTPSGDPVVGSSVTWQTVDGTKRGVNPVVTDADGAAKFIIINTGPVIFRLSGGRAGTSATQIYSASLTDVIAKSGTSITVTLPNTPSVVRRTITASMPDGAPVPGVALSISGGVLGFTSTGVTTNLRSFTTSWSYDGWLGKPGMGCGMGCTENYTTANANGALTFSGFEVQSVGRDVTATFSDGEIEQDASGSLTSATTDLVFDQMPVVQMIVDTETYFEPGKPVTVIVIAVDGTGDPISDTSINLAAVTGSASSLSTAFLNAAERHPNAVSCTQKLSAKTKANGRVTLTLCPTTTKAWRADGTNIVASKPATVRIKSAPGAPKVSTVTASAGKLTVTFTKPASNGGATIKNYEYSTNNGTTWKAFSPADTSTPLMITKPSDTTGSLVKGTTYKVRIRAINSRGKGTASASKTIIAK